MTATQDQLLDQEFYIQVCVAEYDSFIGIYGTIFDISELLQKTYCKTASLMANSAKSIAVLSGHSPEV